MKFFDVWQDFLILFDKPEIKFFIAGLSILSFLFSLFALRELRRVLSSHENDILVRQNYFLDEQWQRLNMALITNDSATRSLAEHLKLSDGQIIQKYALLQMLINILGSAYSAKRRGLMTEHVYQAHFVSVALYFRNSPELFFSCIYDGEYVSEFMSDCRRRFEGIKPLSDDEMRKIFVATQSRSGTSEISARY